mmetsp:Transcript_11721/g.35572  ORF Transcript_11721/g.35572 Transcript_11721/m.35572 type:complete len:139 (+) Transcript_11721:218-634(+)
MSATPLLRMGVQRAAVAAAPRRLGVGPVRAVASYNAPRKPEGGVGPLWAQLLAQQQQLLQRPRVVRFPPGEAQREVRFPLSEAHEPGLPTPLEALNRNGRKAKKANHGARPCSSDARRFKRKQRMKGKMRRGGGRSGG